MEAFLNSWQYRIKIMVMSWDGHIHLMILPGLCKRSATTNMEGPAIRMRPATKALKLGYIQFGEIIWMSLILTIIYLKK